MEQSKEKAGDAWMQYIKQFEKLNEYWLSLPEPTQVWLSQQIDIFAGKYPITQEETQDELWKSALSLTNASVIFMDDIKQQFTITRNKSITHG